MRVEVGGIAYIGFANEHYNAEKHGKTCQSTACVWLYDGMTFIDTAISQDGQEHYHDNHLGPHIPAAPFDLAVRCEAVSNVPQIQFNEDGVWHDFAPGRVALKYSAKANSPNGMLPYLRVDEPKGVTPSEAI